MLLLEYIFASLWRPLLSWRIMTGSVAPLAAGTSSAPLSRHCAAPLLSVCQTREPRERSEPPFSELVASPPTDNNKNTDKSGVFSADIEREDLPEKERRGCAQRTTGKGIHFTAFSRLLSGAIGKQPTGLLQLDCPVSIAHFVIPKRSLEEWEEEKEGGYRAPERARGPGFFSTLNVQQRNLHLDNCFCLSVITAIFLKRGDLLHIFPPESAPHHVVGSSFSLC